jgi:hypothetical protein
MNVVRNFAVVDPYVKIVPAKDPATGTDISGVMRKYLGTYVALDPSGCSGESCYDYSDTNFEAIVGTPTIALDEEYHPAWIESEISENAQWTVNGEKLDIGSTASLNMSDAQIGDAFQVSFDALYQQRLAARRALYYIWGINQFQTTETILSHSVRVEILENEAAVSVAKKYQKFFAAMFTNTPGDVLFMVRIMLTAFLLIFLGGLAYTPASRKIF